MCYSVLLMCINQAHWFYIAVTTQDVSQGITVISYLVLFIVPSLHLVVDSGIMQRDAFSLQSHCKSCIYRACKQQTDFHSHAWIITSTEKAFPEYAIACLVLGLFKVCDTHCNAALAYNCCDAFPSLAVTDVCNTRKK